MNVSADLLSLTITTTNMPPVLNISRESLTGNINVTPVPIETPIHTRPVLQSHRYTAVNTAIKHSTTAPKPDHFNWPVCILFILLSALLGLILSKWGWSWITGRIWKLTSGWEGPLEEEDEHLLADPEPSSPDPAPSNDMDIGIPKFTPSGFALPSPVPLNDNLSIGDLVPSSSAPSHSEVEDWILAHPREKSI